MNEKLWILAIWLGAFFQMMMQTFEIGLIMIQFMFASYGFKWARTM